MEDRHLAELEAVPELAAALEDLAVEMLARGLSVRDIEDAFRADDGRLLLSRTAVSELGEQLWRDYQDFATRDLGEHEIVYLFVDGIAERIRPGQKREPVMAAWGFTATGSRVLLHLMAGSKEDAETVSAFFQDMRARGLGDPLLVVSDGAPGVIKAIETCFPRSARQRCLAHRMRNLAAKVPEDLWPEMKARIQAAYQAPSRAIARDLARGVVEDFERDLPSAMACFTDDFEACIAHLRMPVTHRRAIRPWSVVVPPGERVAVHPERARGPVVGPDTPRPLPAVALLDDVTVDAEPVTSAERISSLDTVRGIALCGILLMNITGFGLPFGYSDPTNYGGDTGLNLLAWLTTTLFFEGTMRGMFTMLFGVLTYTWMFEWDSLGRLRGEMSLEETLEGILLKRGSWFSYGDTKLGQGRDAVKNLLNDNSELAEELETKIREGLSEVDNT